MNDVSTKASTDVLTLRRPRLADRALLAAPCFFTTVRFAFGFIAFTISGRLKKSSQRRLHCRARLAATPSRGGRDASKRLSWCRSWARHAERHRVRRGRAASGEQEDRR